MYHGRSTPYIRTPTHPRIHDRKSLFDGIYKPLRNFRLMPTFTPLTVGIAFHGSWNLPICTTWMAWMSDPGGNESAPIRQVRSRAPWLVQTETWYVQGWSHEELSVHVLTISLQRKRHDHCKHICKLERCPQVACERVVFLRCFFLEKEWK